MKKQNKTKQNRKNFNATNRITVFIIYRQRSTDQRVGQITLYLLWSYHFNVPFFFIKNKTNACCSLKKKLIVYFCVEQAPVGGGICQHIAMYVLPLFLDERCSSIFTPDLIGFLFSIPFYVI